MRPVIYSFTHFSFCHTRDYTIHIHINSLVICQSKYCCNWKYILILNWTNELIINLKMIVLENRKYHRYWLVLCQRGLPYSSSSRSTYDECWCDEGQVSVHSGHCLNNVTLVAIVHRVVFRMALLYHQSCRWKLIKMWTALANPTSSKQTLIYSQQTAIDTKMFGTL